MSGILDRFRLDNKRAIVTGGAIGIGRAIAEALAEAGADVAVADIANFDNAQALVEKIKQMGQESHFIKADVRIIKDVQQMVAQVVDKWERIDILVNNAGICLNAPAEDMTEAQWDDVIDINLKGVFLCCQAVGRQMIKQKSGAIVNVGSMSAEIANYPQPQVAYNAAKAGVHILTKCLATEWARFNIRVNAIAPGYVETELTRPFLDDNPHEAEEYWYGGALQNRIGRPDEIAGAVLYLASEAASYATGSVLTVDGGFTCR